MNILRKIIRKAKNAQLVSFRPEHETLHETGYVPPRPAKYYVPDWYRKIPQTVNKQQGINPVTQEKQHTVRHVFQFLMHLPLGTFKSSIWILMCRGLGKVPCHSIGRAKIHGSQFVRQGTQLR